jgi:hypothetical protein
MLFLSLYWIHIGQERYISSVINPNKMDPNSTSYLEELA